LAGALKTNRGPWQELALELFSKEADHAVRANLMSSLSMAESEVLAKAATLGLRDVDAGVRDWAAHSAVRLFANHKGTTASDMLAVLLVERLKDEDAGVRATTVRALSFAENTAYVDEMAALLTDEDPTTRLAAVDALVRLDAEDAKRRIDEANLIQDADPRVARAAKRL
jgi:HEAT repeat protein